MKIIVIGLGSMGKRRIRLLMEHKDIECYGIDSNEERCQEVRDKYGLRCFASIGDAISAESIEAALICTSPLSHAAIIKECLENSLHVFTEINLVDDGYRENIQLAKEKGLVLFLSSTFLYRKETKTIIEKVRGKCAKLNYVYHVGQYLPDWHPWENYNNYFIGNPRTNGCREIMAIDMPWLWTAFGPVKKVHAIKSKNTELNIQYNDNYLVMLEHESGTKGVFAVDVVTRKPIRHIDIYGEHLQLSWSGTADSLQEYNFKTKEMQTIQFTDASEHVEGYAAFITENPYREEIKTFLAKVNDISTKVPWNFEDDLTLLDVISEIER